MSFLFSFLASFEPFTVQSRGYRAPTRLQEEIRGLY